MPTDAPTARPWVHVAAQLVGLVMVVVAVGIGWGFAWGLGAGGVGVIALGIAAERARTGEAADAG